MKAYHNIRGGCQCSYCYKPNRETRKREHRSYRLKLKKELRKELYKG